MKKTLSLVLAVVLAFGASATAFAAHNSTEDGTVVAVQFRQNVDRKDQAYVTGDIGVLPNTENMINMASNKLAAGSKVSNSKAFYLELDTDGDMKSADILKTKVKAEWAVGKDLVEKVSIVYKKYTPDGTLANADYGYFVEIKAKPGIMMSAADLEGKVKVSKSSFTSVPTTQEFIFGFGTYGEADVKFVSEASDINDSSKETTNHTVFESSNAASSGRGLYGKIVSFQKNKLTETTITFNGVAEYEINLKDQDKLYLAFDRKVNADIIAKHEYANMEFVNFPGKPMFYRTGLFYLYANDAETFVYETKEDGTIAAVKTVWDEDYDAHKFAVRQFAGTYIVSDVELQLDAAPVAPVAPETKPNPNTGR